MNLRLPRLHSGGLLAVAVAWLIAAGGLRGVTAESGGRPAATPAKVALPGPLILDDVPAPLVPRQPPSEAELDRGEALALFAAARNHEHRGEEARALRLYQRALRCDPQAIEAARSTVSLAFRLKRPAEAIRYALKAVESEDADALLLRRLGMHLTEEGDFRGAVSLYERAIAARAGTKETAADILLRMEMGRLYHLVDQYGKAADCFTRVLYALDHPKEFGLDEKVRQVLLGEPGPTYNLFGECYLLSDRPQQAQAAFEQANRLAPNKGLMQLNRARVYARTGKPAEAMKALEACFAEKLATEGLIPYELLAEVLEKLGRAQQLLPRLEKLRARDPENLPLGHFLADRYRQARQFDKAESLYRALGKKTPTLNGYRALLEIYAQTGQVEPLLAVLGEAIEKAGVLDTLGAEGEAVAGSERLMRDLVAAAREKHRQAPEKLDYGMRLAVAMLAMECKQFDIAGEFFDLALKAKPAKAGELLLIWGVGLLVGERPAEAAKVFQRGIDEKAAAADNPLFYFYLAGALAAEDRIDEALAAARKAAELKPELARFHARVSWVLYRGKRYDEAVQAYTALVEKFDADHRSAETREVLREARLVLSNLYVIRQQLAQAEEWLEQVLDEFPDDIGALNDLGYLWADEGKHLGRARRMIQAAVEAEPDNAAYRDSLGWVLYRLGRTDEAIVALEKAAASRPDAVVLDHLGDAYQKAKQPERAKQAWRRAAEAFQQENEPEKAKQVEQKIH